VARRSNESRIDHGVGMIGVTGKRSGIAIDGEDVPGVGMAAGPGSGHPGSSEGMIADPEEGTCPIDGAGADLGSADATVEEESVSECIVIGVPGNGPAESRCCESGRH
jgi:hypothetical protein